MSALGALTARCVSILCPDWKRPGWKPVRASLGLMAVGVLLVALPALPVGTADSGAVDPGGVLPEQGHAYVIPLHRAGLWGESDREGTSTLELLEDGVPLPSPHALHAQIRGEGGGAYSHWGGVVYFSASDGSDPRTNGRRYSFRIRRRVADVVPYHVWRLSAFPLACRFAGVVLLLLPWFCALRRTPGGPRAWWRHAGRPLGTAAALLAAAAFALWLNLLDVTLAGPAVVHALAAAGLALFGLVVVFVGQRGHRRFVRETGDGFRLIEGLTLLVAAVPAFLALLLAAEAAARVVPAETSLALDPGVKFFWPEWFWPRNSLGHSDREPGPKSGPRVMILGDSYTEGAGVRRSERFSRVFAEAMRDAGTAVEVLNAGHCGFDTMDEALALEHTGESFGPDAVIVAYVLNDAEGVAPASKRPLGTVEHLMIVRLRSYLFYRLYLSRHRFRMSRGGPGAPTTSELTVAQHAPGSPGWRRVQEGLGRIAAWCDRHGARKILVAYPYFQPHADELRPVMDRVVDEARRHGFLARSALDDFPGPWEEYAYTAFDTHPDVRAHRIMGERLAELVGPVATAYRPSPAPAGPGGGGEAR